MERLICSSSLPFYTPQKLQLLLPQVSIFDIPNIRFLALSRFSCRHIFSVSSKQEEPSSKPLSSTRMSIPCLKFASTPPTPLSDRSLPVYPFGESFSEAETESDHFFQKALTSGIVILLSPLIGILFNTILGDPSYASIQTAATTQGRIIGSELLSSACTGFFAGCLHTLSAPDHLAALAPLSIGRTRMESAAVGALWGCGHNTGQVIFGLLFLLLKDHLHIEVIHTWGTGVVGVTLLIIGAMGVREALEVPISGVAPENEECGMGILESPDTASNGKTKIGIVTFATGIVHGLQPDALMMVLSTLALPSRLAGAAFLGTFLLGTVLAMGSYTVFIGSCSRALKEQIPTVTEKLTWAASLIAITLGVAILISQSLGFNLY